MARVHLNGWTLHGALNTEIQTAPEVHKTFVNPDMSEVHKIQLPAVPADKESGKQIRSQIVASREAFRRMLELQRASISGYDPDGEESMMQSRQRHQAIKDELDVLRGKAKLGRAPSR